MEKWCEIISLVSYSIGAPCYEIRFHKMIPSKKISSNNLIKWDSFHNVEGNKESWRFRSGHFLILLFPKIISKCRKSFIMEIPYDGMHAWLLGADSRYVVVWKHFHVTILLWYTVALVDERWGNFLKYSSLKWNILSLFYSVLSLLNLRWILIHLWL